MSNANLKLTTSKMVKYLSPISGKEKRKKKIKN